MSAKTQLFIGFYLKKFTYQGLYANDKFVFCVQDLKAKLDRGKKLPLADGILINGRGPSGASFTVEQGE